MGTGSRSHAPRGEWVLHCLRARVGRGLQWRGGASSSRTCGSRWLEEDRSGGDVVGSRFELSRLRAVKPGRSSLSATVAALRKPNTPSYASSEVRKESCCPTTAGNAIRSAARSEENTSAAARATANRAHEGVTPNVWGGGPAASPRGRGLPSSPLITSLFSQEFQTPAGCLEVHGKAIEPRVGNGRVR